jgi:hypothetical protein
LTEKDVIIQDMRRELKQTKAENEKLKERIEEQEKVITLKEEWIAEMKKRWTAQLEGRK